MKKPQNIAVLDYLHAHKKITPLDALTKLGVMRLGARIWDLRRSGVVIITDMVRVHTRAGMARVAAYRMGK